MKTLISLLIISLLIAGCSSTQYTVKDFPESPCFNPKLIELEKKNIKSESENFEYMSLKKMCEDHKNSIAEQNELNKISTNINNMFTFQIVAVTVFLIAFAVAGIIASGELE